MLKKMWLMGFVLGAALLTFSTLAWSAPVPGRTAYHVNDYALVLDPETKVYLEGLLKDFEKKQKVEIVITIFRSTEGMPSDKFIPKYTRKWRWWPPFERDRRIHFIVFTEDANLWFGIGKPLGKIISHKMITDAMNNKILPYFKKGDFAGGVRIGTESIVDTFLAQ